MQTGQPDALSLAQVGYMVNVVSYVSHYPQPAGGSIVDRFSRDIFRAAREKGEGHISVGFENVYNLLSVSLAFRKSTVTGTADVVVVKNGAFLTISADIYYNFYDRYTDPYDFSDHSDDTEDEIYDDGIPYDIRGFWSARLEAVIKRDASESRFP